MSIMQVDRGFSRETVVMCDVGASAGIAGKTACFECGGDGDWTKFHPEPQSLDAPMQCVNCKGTGKVWVSI
ncbi:hypothetical protein [Bradyrhizobium ivorense]|uniref:hypothetical protein n=1 Tax=Bradyrhizobium ivorense TaxID=2511166 RepID=UPI0010B38F33|nr:hypothetical protein [Bradyrhizobium ivorense]VIO73846.1 hypothetical protein CI41S_39550 [Bradyrhizobium ivorense]